jgi:hypothetical protein
MIELMEQIEFETQRLVDQFPAIWRHPNKRHVFGRKSCDPAWHGGGSAKVPQYNNHANFTILDLTGR